jgi:hypothetical protein
MKRCALAGPAVQRLCGRLRSCRIVTAILPASGFWNPYGWCIAVTFPLFVLFYIGRTYALSIPAAEHSLNLLVACGSMLFGMWLMYREQRQSVR